MNFDSIPSELRSKVRSVVWKPVRDKDGKIKKVPWKPDGSGELKWKDPKNLLNWQDVVEAYYIGRDHGLKFGGIGFILDSIRISSSASPVALFGTAWIDPQLSVETNECKSEQPLSTIQSVPSS